MKFMALTILILTIFCRLQAPEFHQVLITKEIGIRPYERIWNAVIAVESNGNPLAIGDKHLKEHSYGIVQIRQSRLDDYFKQTGIRYTTYDMFDPAKAKSIFLHYATKIGYKDPERIARCWNGGSENGMKYKATAQYWKLVQIQL